MPRFKNFVPQGVIPATLLAFNDDFSINEKETRRHLSFVAATLVIRFVSGRISIHLHCFGLS